MTSSTVWIVIAVVAVLLIAALVFATTRARNRRRARQAEEIREQARLETAKLERREAFAEETAAKARAAQAEAEVKAAEAARLQERATVHQSEAATSREQLQEEWQRADSIDPKIKAKDRENADAPATGSSGAWAQEQATDDIDSAAARRQTSTNYRDASYQ